MKLYNTLTRALEDFDPIDEDSVRMYTCGPTVYREIHIGNLRTYLTTDLLRRIFSSQEKKVTSVMNITDVGHMRYSSETKSQIDPIMLESAKRGITPLELSKHYTSVFLKDMRSINVKDSDVLPKATEHIDEMIAIIKILIDKGFAYVTDGNVYFKVKAFKSYGQLSGNTLDKMDQLLEAVRVSVETDKKNTADFALWKKAPEDSVMKWDSPWGEGVPGWHIECSAMAIKYLGDTFDIHAGGEDLIFPHHEDEIAQSEGASGVRFVNHWVHTNYLLVDGEKMSRSKGTGFTIADIEERGFFPLAFRYLSFQTHYRARMNFTWEALESAQTALEKLYSIAEELPEPGVGLIEYERDFQDAVENDLNLPQALSTMWEMLKSKNEPRDKAHALVVMDDILGLKIFENAHKLVQVPDHIMQMVREREDLRRQRKFTQADHMRNKIEKLGYVLKDEGKSTKVTRRV